MEMRSFQHVTPPLRLFHGPDSLGQLGRELDRLKSKRAVIFCGNTLARQGTLLELVRGAIGERCAGVFSAVKAHSPVPSVQAAAEELKRLQADAAIALGGGSAIVTARAASILAAENGGVRDLCTTRDEKGGLRSPRLAADKIPQVIVPTTPTTAMVKAGSAVFDPPTGERLALFDPKTRAQSIFIHPQMLESAPQELVATASFNTLATAIEGLMSKMGGNPLSDALLMHSVRLLGQHLPQLKASDDAGVRGELVLAAMLCGQGTDHTGAGITIVLGHAIGAKYDMENGTANAAVLPHVLRFNAEAAPAGLAKVAAALGLPAGSPAAQAEAVVKVAESISGSLGFPRRLRDAGLPADAIPAIAEAAMGDWFLGGNPRKVDAAQMQEVIQQAW